MLDSEGVCVDSVADVCLLFAYSLEQIQNVLHSGDDRVVLEVCANIDGWLAFKKAGVGMPSKVVLFCDFNTDIVSCLPFRRPTPGHLSICSDTSRFFFPIASSTL